jgi:hypothetical protein
MSGRVDPAGVARGRENRPCSTVQVSRGHGGRHGSVTMYERPERRGVHFSGKSRQTRAPKRMARRSRSPR